MSSLVCLACRGSSSFPVLSLLETASYIMESRGRRKQMLCSVAVTALRGEKLGTRFMYVFTCMVQVLLSVGLRLRSLPSSRGHYVSLPSLAGRNLQ